MANRTDTLLNQQNHLLEQQNDLIEKINQLLQQQNNLIRQNISINGVLSPPRISGEEFVENLYDDEIRSGFLVTSHRKKLWNVQIGLINEFARICKKYNLRWFAWDGTLLGAARHKGFIPWDDDVDLMMLRPDYEKFKQIAVKEFQHPYYFDNTFDYRWDLENNNSADEVNFPVVHNTTGGWPFYSNYLKIRDSRTTMIEFSDRKNVNQGIWIDIFVLDSVPPFNDQQKNQIFSVGGILYHATFHPKLIVDAINKKQPLPIDLNSLKRFLNLTFRKRGLQLENFLTEHFFNFQYVGRIEHNFLVQKPVRYKAENFNKVEYLPFEKIELPVPANYDEILQANYGDWHKMIITHTHVQTYSADIPYYEYFKNSVI